MDKDTILIGYDNTSVPMGFEDKGKASGFDVDLADAFSKVTGKKVQFKNIDWDLKETELNSGKIDLIWNGYSSSPERLKRVDASIPYLNNSQVILVLDNSKVQTKADLAGQKVGTQASSAGEQAVNDDKQFAASLAGGAPTAYPTYDQALRDLEVGRVQAVVGDKVLLGYYAKQHPQTKYRQLAENLGDEEYVVGIRKGDTKTKEALDKFLNDAKSDGTLAQINDKWFK